MRGLLLAAALLAVMFSGCLADTDGDGKPDGFSGGTSSGAEIVGSDAEGNKVRAGDDLGTLTFEESGENGVKNVDPRCEGAPTSGGVAINSGDRNHQWTIPTTDPDGVSWRASTLTITLTEDQRTTTDLDFYVEDAYGNELARSSETGPDGTDGPEPITLSNVSPGTLNIHVFNCGGAAIDYTVTGTAHMVAVSSGQATSTGDASSSSSGDVTVTPKTDGNGNVYYEASRQETYTATLSGATGKADISTGAGYITYTGGSGDDYKLLATLKARGDSEQEARERLAEMYIDHTAQDGAAVVLDAHGRPGGDGQWNKKQIDLVFDAPSAIDWTSFSASTSAGYLHVDTVTGTLVDLDTSAGYVQVDGVDADTLDAHTSAGYINVRDTRATDLDLDTSAGAIDAVMRASTASGSWDLSASAGQVVLKVVENSDLGYDVDASTSAGSVTFNFDDVEETETNCQYASCHRHGRTNGYESRSVKVVMDLSTSAGQVTVGS